MQTIQIQEREMTDAEFARMNAGFDEHTIEHGNPLQTSERFGFVALDGETFIGCVSGLADKEGDVYNKWFYLSDLFVEKAYRGQGLGAVLLRKLEERVAALGIRHIWTWTAGYEAPGFYLKQGYIIFTEQEDWYATGHSRVGLRKIVGG
jgi:GNAT superfamily N-acetyltransferase